MNDSPEYPASLLGRRTKKRLPTTTRSLNFTRSWPPSQGQAPLITETNQTSPLLPKHTIRRNGRRPYPERLTKTHDHEVTQTTRRWPSQGQAPPEEDRRTAPVAFSWKIRGCRKQESTGMATVLESKNKTSSIKDLEGETARVSTS